MKIALVGNQNSGKTTLFNCLTGMNAKIGNWPGVTIEKKSAKIKGTNNEIVDLPGIYSLSPYSLEEEVARKFVFEENPDVIVNIVDSTSLERSLYLTTQLLELDSKVIIALNMTDMLEKKKIKIDIHKLEQRLGTRVIKISALKQTGIKELINQINTYQKSNQIQIFDSKIENAINIMKQEIPKSLPHQRFVAIKVLEEDNRFEKYITVINQNIIKTVTENYDTDLEEIIATQRYNFIHHTKNECFVQQIINKTITDKLDKIFLNKTIAFPIFIIIMFLIYYLSVGVVGKYTGESIENAVNKFGIFAQSIMQELKVAKWLNSLVVDGAIAGIGAVLTFIPQLTMLFMCITILEATGYMSRIAMLLDRMFRKIGLSGKSLIPFIIGSGCSVPGIMGSRIIENQDERKMTAILTPFIPCSAKLPIIAIFTGSFFERNAGLVAASLYFFAICVIIFSAFIIKKFVLKSTATQYISELPEYKIPNMKYVLKEVFNKVKEFIERAGTTIFTCSIIIWFLLSFSFSLEYGVNIEKSILAEIGKKISWIFYPILGTNSWGATVSAIQGLVAKEQVISSMAVIGGLSENVKEGANIFAKGGGFEFFTSASAYAFMVFNLFSAPCFGALSAMKKELGGIKKLLKVMIYEIVLAWILATITYQIGSRGINYSNILVILIIIFILTKVQHHQKIKKTNNCIGCPYINECSK